MSEPEIIARRPNEWSNSELDRFVELVELGGEVVPGLKDRIMNAVGLVMIRTSDGFLGTSALKRPNQGYKERQFAKAKIPALAEHYQFEIGWIFLHEELRGRRLSSDLVHQTIGLAGGSPIFATTREDNVAMKRVLEHFEFEPRGELFPSGQNPGRNLQIYLKG